MVAVLLRFEYSLDKKVGQDREFVLFKLWWNEWVSLGIGINWFEIDGPPDLMSMVS